MRQNLKVPTNHEPARARRTRRFVRPAAFAALGICAATLLAGCHTSPGAAAIVGDSRISDATLDSAVQDGLAFPAWKSAVSGDEAAYARYVLGTLVLLRLLESQAAQDHVTVGDAQVSQAVSQIVAQNGGQAHFDTTLVGSGLAAGGEAPSDFENTTRLNLLAQAIAQAEGVSANLTQQPQNQQQEKADQKAVQLIDTDLANQSKALGVRIDPRYGSWNPQRNAVLPPTSLAGGAVSSQ